jgi:hypothetical protein
MPINPETAVYDVPDQLLSKFGFRRGAHSDPNVFICTDPHAIAILMSELRWPISRALDPQRLEYALRCFRDGIPQAAVPVYCPEGTRRAVVLDGAHRLAVASALGLPAVPCVKHEREDIGDIVWEQTVLPWLTVNGR